MCLQLTCMYMHLIDHKISTPHSPPALSSSPLVALSSLLTQLLAFPTYITQTHNKQHTTCGSGGDQFYLSLCQLLYPAVLLICLLSLLHSHHDINIEWTASILSLHLHPHPLQGSQQHVSAGSLVWDIVQTLLDQLDQSRVEPTNMLQRLHISLTTFQLISGSKISSIVRIHDSTGEKVSWKLLKSSNSTIELNIVQCSELTCVIMKRARWPKEKMSRDVP